MSQIFYSLFMYLFLCINFILFLFYIYCYSFQKFWIVNEHTYLPTLILLSVLLSDITDHTTTSIYSYNSFDLIELKFCTHKRLTPWFLPPSSWKLPFCFQHKWSDHAEYISNFKHSVYIIYVKFYNVYIFLILHSLSKWLKATFM